MSKKRRKNQKKKKKKTRKSTLAGHNGAVEHAGEAHGVVAHVDELLNFSQTMELERRDTSICRIDAMDRRDREREREYASARIFPISREMSFASASFFVRRASPGIVRKPTNRS
jgi:hypothetical protein